MMEKFLKVIIDKSTGLDKIEYYINEKSVKLNYFYERLLKHPHASYSIIKIDINEKQTIYEDVYSERSIQKSKIAKETA